jgi:hypothetical protein
MAYVEGELEEATLVVNFNVMERRWNYKSARN